MNFLYLVIQIHAEDLRYDITVTITHFQCIITTIPESKSNFFYCYTGIIINWNNCFCLYVTEWQESIIQTVSFTSHHLWRHVHTYTVNMLLFHKAFQHQRLCVIVLAKPKSQKLAVCIYHKKCMKMHCKIYWVTITLERLSQVHLSIVVPVSVPQLWLHLFCFYELFLMTTDYVVISTTNHEGISKPQIWKMQLW